MADIYYKLIVQGPEDEEPLDEPYYEISNTRKDADWLMWTSGTTFKDQIVWLSDNSITLPADCGSLFYGVQAFNINWAHVDTSEVVSMNHMFYDACNAYYSYPIDISTWDLSNVTSMRYTFGGYGNNMMLITGTHPETTKLTNIDGLFANTSSLSWPTARDISWLNTSAVTSMVGLFSNCRRAQSIKFGGLFSTESCTDFGQLFIGCSSLTSLDLSTWDMSNAVSTADMFNSCTNLETILVGDRFILDNVTNSSTMFRDNTNLVGAKGTAYNDSNPKDKTYAHIDNAPTDPGYFGLAKNWYTYKVFIKG